MKKVSMEWCVKFVRSVKAPKAFQNLEAGVGRTLLEFRDRHGAEQTKWFYVVLLQAYRQGQDDYLGGLFVN